MLSSRNHLQNYNNKVLYLVTSSKNRISCILFLQYCHIQIANRCIISQLSVSFNSSALPNPHRLFPYAQRSYPRGGTPFLPIEYILSVSPTNIQSKHASGCRGLCFCAIRRAKLQKKTDICKNEREKCVRLRKNMRYLTEIGKKGGSGSRCQNNILT